MNVRGFQILLERGAADVPHPGGTLAAHLRRVESRLADHGVDRVGQVAGLCHAAYGTDGFPTVLVGLDERDDLRLAIGGAAEAAVYQYACCDRAVVHPQLGDDRVEFWDRFTGAVETLIADELRTFCAITVANELDVAEHSSSFGEDDRASPLDLFERIAPFVTDAARDDIDATLGH
jgi:hypothetical protein